MEEASPCGMDDLDCIARDLLARWEQAERQTVWHDDSAPEEDWEYE
jgi:hypothetical protein